MSTLVRPGRTTLVDARLPIGSAAIWMTVHGAVMVVGGVAFGIGVVRSAVLLPWTGWALAVGVVLVAAASAMGNLERTIAAAVPDAAFIGMGVALLRRPEDAI